MDPIMHCYCSKLRDNDLRLTKLNLACMFIDSFGATWLAQALKDNTNLLDLNLRRNSIGNQGLQALAPVLLQIQRVVLSRNEISNDGVTCLVDEFIIKGKNSAKRTSLQVLILSYNDITCRGAMTLARSLKEPTCSLVELILTGNNVGDAGAEQLALTLEKDSTLRVLGLRKCSVGQDGAIALARGLETNDCLTKLDLFSNPIHNKDKNTVLVAFANTLQRHNKTLQFLFLFKNTANLSDLQEKIMYLLVGNRAGRKYVGNLLIPFSLWPLILARSSNPRDHPPDLLYYLIREKPELVQRI